MLVYKENEALKQENRMLREKISMVEDELHRIASGNQQETGQIRALKDEVERLSHALMEKERMADREMADQKTEWAEIYGAQKNQFDQQQREITLLN